MELKKLVALKPKSEEKEAVRIATISALARAITENRRNNGKKITGKIEGLDIARLLYFWEVHSRSLHTCFCPVFVTKICKILLVQDCSPKGPTHKFICWLMNICNVRW